MQFNIFEQPIVLIAIAFAALVAAYAFARGMRTDGWKKKTLLGISALGMLSVVVMFWGSFIGPQLITVKRETIDVPACQLEKPLTIVLFSDIQVDDWKNAAFTQKAVSMINGLDKDLVVFAGDFVNDRVAYVDGLAPFTDLTKPRLGIYGVMGNHDYDAHGDGNFNDSLAGAVRAQLASTPMTILDNESVSLRHGNDTILLIGSDDIWTDHHDITAVLDQENKKPYDCRLLLTHNPDTISALRSQDLVNLVMAGHTHGGQVRLPIVGPLMKIPTNLGQHYDKGLFAWDRDTSLYITSGIGEVQPIHARLFNPPEIVVLTIQ